MGKRIVLGFFAVAALAFGTTLLVLCLGGQDKPLPGNIHEWGLIPGPLAFGVWVGGQSTSKDFPQQLRLGGLAMILAVVATTGIGYVVSLAAVEGAARAYLKLGVYGAVQMIVGLFLIWAAAKSRWPVPGTG